MKKQNVLISRQNRAGNGYSAKEKKENTRRR
jgi:hypothetical protein